MQNTAQAVGEAIATDPSLSLPIREAIGQAIYAHFMVANVEGHADGDVRIDDVRTSVIYFGFDAFEVVETMADGAKLSFKGAGMGYFEADYTVLGGEGEDDDFGDTVSREADFRASGEFVVGDDFSETRLVREVRANPLELDITFTARR